MEEGWFNVEYEDNLGKTREERQKFSEFFGKVEVVMTESTLKS